MIKLKSISILGLKGRERRVYDLSPRVLVVGDNGTQKSSVRDALDFLLGRRVAGVAGDKGRALLGAVGGGTVEVEAVFDVEGTLHTVKRSRVLERDTFREAVLEVDGSSEKAAERLDSMLGDTSAPAGAAWLDLSDDKLLGELAVLGADTQPELLPGMLDELAKHVPDIMEYEQQRRALVGRPAAMVTFARETARDLLKKRRAELAVATKSSEASRVAAANDRVRPEDVERLQGDVSRIATANAEREARIREAQANLDAAQGQIDRHQADARAMAAQIETIAARLLPADAKRPDVAALAAALEKARTDHQAARNYLADERGEQRAAAEVYGEKTRAVDQAETMLEQARGHLALLKQGCCPTCHQAITVAVRSAFDDAVRATATALQAAQEAKEAQRLYLQQVASSVAAAEQAEQRALETVGAAEHRLGVARQLAAAFDADADRRAEHDRLKKALHDHRANVPPSTAALADAFEVARARPAEDLRAAQERLRLATEATQRVKRWREDLASREATEAAVDAAKRAVELVAEVEGKLADAGADRLLVAVRQYMPAQFGRPVYSAGTLGLEHEDGSRSYGPGLSEAQRLVFSLALDRALDEITGRRFRTAVVEADPLSAATREWVRRALEADVATDQIDLVVLITCHPPVSAWNGWTEIQTSPTVQWDMGPAVSPETFTTVLHRLEYGSGDVEIVPVDAPQSSLPPGEDDWEDVSSDADDDDDTWCRVCGCTETAACIGPQGACCWVDDPEEIGLLCSACICPECREPYADAADVEASDGGPCAECREHRANDAAMREDEERHAEAAAADDWEDVDAGPVTVQDTSMSTEAPAEATAGAGAPAKRPRVFEDPPNLFRVRGVVLKLGDEARAALRDAAAEDLDGPVLDELELAGFVAAASWPDDGELGFTPAGQIARRMLAGERVDGVSLETAEPPPPPPPAPDDVGASERELKALVSDLSPSSPALRAAIDLPDAKLSHAALVRVLAETWCRLGFSLAEARARLVAACAANPKRARKKGGGDGAENAAGPSVPEGLADGEPGGEDAEPAGDTKDAPGCDAN